MRPIATKANGVKWSVDRSVYLSVMIVSPANMAEQIEMQFGMLSRVGPGNHVLDVGAHWRHLANTIRPSVYSVDVALSQIILTTCLGVLLR